ncbi:MAG: hypothetical protein IKF91_00305 [Bacilli bacterium]|nr:hypothetical protein [Bacilli bacterium]
MKIRSERDKRTYLIIALCAILVVMGVGYAAFSSLLTINGTANISNSWCLGFDNTMTNTMQVTKGLSTGTTPTGSMSYSGTACGSNLQPNSSLNAHFYQPGDEIEYTLTITNKSTVTAAIKSILVDNESVTSNTTKKKGNITYVVEMPLDTTLDVNESTTMKVIAKFQNETDVTENVNGETQTIEVKINAEQDDGNGGMDITPVSNIFTGTIYRWSTRQASNGDSIATVSGTKWCANHPQYGNSCDFGTYWDTEQECETYVETNMSGQNATCEQKTGTFGGIGEYTTDASTLNNTYYLKHDVVDDIITNSYVCFVYNNSEHCMKGGDGGASFAANTQMIKDYQTFYNLGAYDSNTDMGCYFGSSNSDCVGGGFNVVYASSNELVEVGEKNSVMRSSCKVRHDGISSCVVITTGVL